MITNFVSIDLLEIIYFYFQKRATFFSIFFKKKKEMAARHEQISVRQRFNKNMHVSLSTRCHRMLVTGLDADNDKTITMELFYSYDTKSTHPLWKKMENATATSVVKDGVVEFFLVLGSIPEEMRTSNTVNALLPRSSQPTAADDLPILSYILNAGESEWLCNNRIALHKSWGDVVFEEAAAFSREITLDAIPDFVPTSRVLVHLKESWEHLFSYTKEKRALVGQGEYDVPFEISFDEMMLLRFIRIAYPYHDAPSTIPSVIPQRLLRGEVPKERTSIFRAFHTFVELIGRSTLVQRMYVENKIALVSSQDVIVFQFGNAQLPPYVFFFRMPRSPTHGAALVLELYRREKHGTLSSVLPTPYITASMLDEAHGDPLRAFFNLDSVHKDILQQLTYDSMLTVQFTSNNTLTVLPPTAFPIKETDNHCNLYWWESQHQLRSCIE